MICVKCNKNSILEYKSKKFGIICSECSKKFLGIKLIVCPICQKTKPGGKICRTCYKKQYKPKRHKCSKCGEIRVIHSNKNGPLCEKCYKRPKKKCSKCKKISVLNQVKPPLCKKCYNQPLKKCVSCGKLRMVSKELCKSCYSKQYSPPNKECNLCNKNKTIQKIYNNKLYCKSCWEKYRMQNDEYFRIKTLIRARIRETFKRHSNGKKLSSSKYNIDFNKIYKHIGDCPGNREEYHIDHIFPISIFNLNDKFEVWAAFHHLNHQWLKKKENLKKSDNYNKDDFAKYMKELKVEYENKT